MNWTTVVHDDTEVKSPKTMMQIVESPKTIV
jgi:hypothetical protein